MEKDKNLITNSVSPWNYEESVKQCKGLVGKYNKLSLEIVRELYAANQALSCSGLRSDLEKNCISDGSNGNLVPNGTRLKTFQDYLSDIGLAKRTAYNWMILYIPEEDRLMSTEEFKQRLIEHAWNAQVAQYFGVSVATVWRIFKEALEFGIGGKPKEYGRSSAWSIEAEQYMKDGSFSLNKPVSREDFINYLIKKEVVNLHVFENKPSLRVQRMQALNVPESIQPSLF